MVGIVSRSLQRPPGSLADHHRHPGGCWGYPPPGWQPAVPWGPSVACIREWSGTAVGPAPTASASRVPGRLQLWWRPGRSRPRCGWTARRRGVWPSTPTAGRWSTASPIGTGTQPGLPACRRRPFRWYRHLGLALSLLPPPPVLLRTQGYKAPSPLLGPLSRGVTVRAPGFPTKGPSAGSLTGRGRGWDLGVLQGRTGRGNRRPCATRQKQVSSTRRRRAVRCRHW